MKTNKAQFALALETTPGTAESLTASDVHIEPDVGSFPTVDTEVFSANTARASSTPKTTSIGRQLVTFPIPYILKPPGSLTTDPEFADPFKAAVMQGDEVQTIAVGTITGTYLAGETITGDVSTATGIVVCQASSSDGEIGYIEVSGTMASGDSITGGTSSASSTASAGPADGGYCFRPADITDFTASGFHATCRYYLDGYQWTGRGCLGDTSFSFRRGEPCQVTQNFTGPLTSNGDAALLTGISLSEASSAPKLCNAGLVIGGYTAEGVVDFEFTYPTGPTPREDANDTNGDCVSFMDYARGDDTPSILTIPLTHVTAATNDFYGDMDAETTQHIEWTLGSTSGNRVTFTIPAAQYVDIQPGERDPRHAISTIQFRCTGTTDDEWFIWQR